MKNFKFQNKAVNDLSEKIISRVYEIKHQSRENDILLNSPVGSGKTYMAALAIKQVIERNKYQQRKYDIAFVWLSSSAGGLCDQSMEKIGGYGVDVVDHKTLIRDGIQPNKCYFIPYEKYNNEERVGMRDGEQKTLPDVFSENNIGGEPTVKIVVFADEAHHNLDADGTSLFLPLIRPYCLVEITATPDPEKNQRNADYIVEVDAKEVMDEYMICQGYNIQNIDDPSNFSIKHLVSEAVKLQEKKKEIWRKHEERLMPKVLIQISDDKDRDTVKSINKNDESNADEIIRELTNNNVSPESIYIWLADEKGHRDGAGNRIADIKRFASQDCPAEYLIFKRAVAKGWDCPEAATLLRLRSGGKPSFNAQTFGRIGRNPIPGRFFDEELIDYADIITDDRDFIIDKDVDDTLRRNIKNKLANEVAVKPQFKAIAERVLITSEKKEDGKAVPPSYENMRTDIRNVLDFNLSRWKKDYAGYYMRQTYLDTNVLSQADVYSEEKISGKVNYRDFDSVLDNAENLFRQEACKNATLKKSINTIIDILGEYSEDHSDGENILQARADLFEKLLSNYDEVSNEFESIAEQTTVSGSTYISEYKIPLKWIDSHVVETDNTNYLYDKSPDWTHDREYNPQNKKKPFFKNSVDKEYHSEVEFALIQYLLESEDVLFWFKAPDSGKDAFSVWYQKRGNITRQRTQKNTTKGFYPDFGVMLKNGVFIWLEGKGGEDDKRSKDVSADETAEKERDIQPYLDRLKNDSKYKLEGVNKDAFFAHGIRIINPVGTSDHRHLVYYKQRGNYTIDYSDSNAHAPIEELFSELMSYEPLPGFCDEDTTLLVKR